MNSAPASTRRRHTATATANTKQSRWVGFDMDECLGSFMPIWALCELIPQQYPMSPDRKQQYLTALAKALASNRRLWIIRPGLDTVLEMLVAAKQRRQIAGCFILTNNGSPELTEVVRQAMNFRAGIPDLFRVGWHRYTPCRKKTGSILVKNLDCIARCLHASGLPPIQRTSDVLFFDDFADHELASEIPHYVTVPAYNYYTPVALVMNDMRSILQGFPRDIVDYVRSQAEQYEARDLKTETALRVHSPPANMGAGEFVEGVRRFLAGSKTTRTTRTVRRATAQRRSKS